MTDIKPFMVRLTQTKVDRLDVLARERGLSRNALVGLILNTYLDNDGDTVVVKDVNVINVEKEKTVDELRQETPARGNSHQVPLDEHRHRRGKVISEHREKGQLVRTYGCTHPGCLHTMTSR